MASRKRRLEPMRFDVKSGTLEGYAVVSGGTIAVHATKGAKGSKTAEVSGSGAPDALAALASVLLLELELDLKH